MFAHGREEKSNISVNLVWIKLSKARFPTLPVDKSFMTDGHADFDKLIPAENIAVLKEWINIYGKDRVTVWLDSALLGQEEYQSLAQGLEKLRDEELQKITELVNYFLQHEKAVDIGYIVDLMKFKAMFHFATAHKNENYVYIHSDFDYVPISLFYITENAGEIGFKTSWIPKHMAENDFFIMDNSHQTRFPDLLTSMNEAHVQVFKSESYKTKDTDALFLETYLNPLIAAVRKKDSIGGEVKTMMLDRKLLEKHMTTKFQVRSWSSSAGSGH